MSSRDTPYFVNFQGGFSGFNNPGGRVFWVAASGYTALNGIGPSDSNSGLSPQKPFSTIQKGLDSCVAGRGDIVALLPGSYTITAALTMTIADVTLCSAHPVAAHDYSPVIITGAATLDVNLVQMDADNTRIIGLGFEAGFTTVTANQEVIQVNSTNTTTDIFGAIIKNCFFDMTRAAGAASASDTDLDVIRVGLDSTDRAFNALVEGCTIRGYDQDGISIEAGSVGAVIRDNRIYDGIGSELGLSGVNIKATNALVSGNRITAGTNSTTAGPINVNVATARAIITDNHLVAWGADTLGIVAINTATFHSARNYIHAVAAGNIIDYVTSATVPSSNIDWGNIQNVDPALPALVTATVGGL